jgi:tRNA1Val (adenine37-N6)-methyltransferase
MISPYSGWGHLKNSDMGRNNYFQFKQFTVIQEHSAMKVGVDSVMLGAWTHIGEAKTILDVGCGTGLLSLMMAQRSSAIVTGIDIDGEACTEAAMNVARSPWPDRINIQTIPFQQFATKHPGRFDLVISNPPYFVNSSKPGDLKRKTARHNDDLPFSAFLEGCALALQPLGRISVILPADKAEDFSMLASGYGFFRSRLLKVRHFPDKPIHRILMEFTQKKITSTEEMLVIESEGQYTEPYRQLTGEFYLAF